MPKYRGAPSRSFSLRVSATATDVYIYRSGFNYRFRSLQHLVVGNGGLGNGIQREEIERLFQCYGTITDICMKPRKAYAFVSFSIADEAAAACKGINGRQLSCPDEVSTPGLRFYVSFIENVPGMEVPTDDLPPGLKLVEDFISEAKERELLDCIDWDSKDANSITESQQVLKHRQVKHFGYEFLYVNGANTVDPEKPLQHGIPEACQPILDTMVENGIVTKMSDQLTVNHYEPGQGIPPHVDTHSAFDGAILSLSLGSQVVMEFRQPGTKQHISVLLPRRSLLVMSEESRYIWTHGITPRKSDIVSVHQKENYAQDPEQTCVNTEDATCPCKDPAAATKLTLVKRAPRTSFTFRKVLRGPCQCKFPTYCDSQTGKQKKSSETHLPRTQDEAAKLEALHVHQVYNEIADHFSDTRHRAWPQVVEFLQNQSEGAVIADIGCGNGKYIGINKTAFHVGCDRSLGLCDISRGRGYEVFSCDCLAVPLRENVCDTAISIAVIHHLSTKERRLQGIREIVRILRLGGQALIYVWAFEQEVNKVKSNYLSEDKVQAKSQNNAVAPCQMLDSTDLSDDTNNIKEMAVNPCSSACEERRTLSSDSDPRIENSSSVDVATGELQSGCPPVETLTVHTNRTHFDSQDLLVPWHLQNKPKHREVIPNTEKSDSGTHSKTIANKKEELDFPGDNCEKQNILDSMETFGEKAVHHRFYHVFRQWELESLCQNIENLTIIKSYYDKGNWCVIVEKC